jgi:hypothetical protein
MNTLFDTLEYTKGAELIGIKREHAEYQAKQLAKLIDDQLVTKSYLVTELKSLEISMIKWMVGIGFAQFALTVSILGFIFKH